MQLSEARPCGCLYLMEFVLNYTAPQPRFKVPLLPQCYVVFFLHCIQEIKLYPHQRYETKNYYMKKSRCFDSAKVEYFR